MKSTISQELDSIKTKQINEYMDVLYEKLPELYESLMDDDFEDINKSSLEIMEQVSKIRAEKLKLN